MRWVNKTLLPVGSCLTFLSKCWTKDSMTWTLLSSWSHSTPPETSVPRAVLLYCAQDIKLWCQLPLTLTFWSRMARWRVAEGKYTLMIGNTMEQWLVVGSIPGPGASLWCWHVLLRLCVFSLRPLAPSCTWGDFRTLVVQWKLPQNLRHAAIILQACCVFVM